MKAQDTELDNTSFIDELIEDFESPKTFELRVPVLRQANEATATAQRGGQVFFFRNWADSEEFEEWFTAAINFGQMVIKAASGAAGAMPVHESWKPYLTQSPKLALEAHLISYLSIEPSREALPGERLSPKLEQVDALKMQKKALHVFRLLAKGIEANKFIHGIDDLAARVERAKKG